MSSEALAVGNEAIGLGSTAMDALVGSGAIGVGSTALQLGVGAIGAVTLAVSSVTGHWSN